VVATAPGQTDSVNKLTFSYYGELYYSYDFSNPANHEKADFIFNHKRHNEISLNLAFGKVSYAHRNVRANFALMTGTYAQYNLSSEPDWAQLIYEASIGVKVSKKTNLWLDAGIMPSHIGFESAVGADCWTVTRSLLAENSPYYETGIKLSLTNRKDNFTASFLALNGWQRIQKPQYVQRPSFGMQLNYKPAGGITFNYSNFIGTDKPDSLNALRTFHNFFTQFQSSKIGLIAGFDFGSDKISAAEYGVWLSPVVILRYLLNDKFRVAFRGEYYKDANQIIVTTKTVNGFKTFGFSANIDYDINNTVLLRIEGKRYKSKDAIFYNNSNENFSITSSLSVKL
jgi:hypothetical protein